VKVAVPLLEGVTTGSMSIGVLIVDPDESRLDSYRDYLTAHGFELENASAGREGLSELSTWKPDALVLEPDMPSFWNRICPRLGPSSLRTE
jgi:DNA-binding response OmpR family regulator